MDDGAGVVADAAADGDTSADADGADPPPPAAEASVALSNDFVRLSTAHTVQLLLPRASSSRDAGDVTSIAYDDDDDDDDEPTPLAAAEPVDGAGEDAATGGGAVAKR